MDFIEKILEFENKNKKYKVEFSFWIKNELQFFIAHYIDKYIFYDNTFKKIKECTSEKLAKISSELENELMKKEGIGTDGKKRSESPKTKRRL